MVCPKCGTQNQNTNFCRGCGTDLRAVAPQQAGPRPVAPQQPMPGYQQPGYQQAGTSGGGYRVNIPKREVGVCIILSVITCGIYGIFWFIHLVNDLNDASGETNDSRGGMVFLLTLITCGIYGIVWMYNAGDKVNIIKQRNGIPSYSNPGILYLALSMFGFSIVSYSLIQSELNKVATL